MYMKKKIIIAIAILANVFVLQDTFAQVKIGYANPARIMSALPAVQEVNTQIDKLISERDEQLSQKASSLQEIFSNYENTMGTLSQEQRDAKEKELLELNQEFEKDRESMMTEIRQKRSELMAPIIQDMNTAMTEVAEEMDLDLVLNEGTSTGDAIVFFANSQRLDITDKIIEKLK